MTVCVEPTGHTLLEVGLVILGTTTSRASRAPLLRPSSWAIRLLRDNSRFTGEAKAIGLESINDSRSTKGARTKFLENIVDREIGRVDSR